MIVTKPTYVVAELPEKPATWVKRVRERLEPATAHFPAEITLAGSSGLGVLTCGQSFTEIERELSSVTKGKTDFHFEFLGVGTFAGTNIFYARPERPGFDDLHAALEKSQLEFETSPFPYTPHCSLKGFTPLQPGQRELLSKLEVPSGKYQVVAISVYEIVTMKPRRLLTLPSAA